MLRPITPVPIQPTRVLLGETAIASGIDRILSGLPAMLGSVEDFSQQDRLLNAAGLPQQTQQVTGWMTAGGDGRTPASGSGRNPQLTCPFGRFSLRTLRSFFGLLKPTTASGQRIGFLFDNFGSQRLFNQRCVDDTFRSPIGILGSRSGRLRSGRLLLLLGCLRLPPLRGATEKIFEITRHRLVPILVRLGRFFGIGRQ